MEGGGGARRRLVQSLHLVEPKTFSLRARAESPADPSELYPLGFQVLQAISGHGAHFFMITEKL